MARRLKVKYKDLQGSAVSRPISRKDFKKAVKNIKAEERQAKRDGKAEKKILKLEQKANKPNIIRDIRNEGFRPAVTPRLKKIPHGAKNLFISKPLNAVTSATLNSGAIMGARYATQKVTGGIKNLKNGALEEGSLKKYVGKEAKEYAKHTKLGKAYKKGKDIFSKDARKARALNSDENGFKSYLPKRARYGAQKLSNANEKRKKAVEGLKNFRTDARKDGMKSALGGRIGNIGKRVASSEKVEKARHKIQKVGTTIVKFKTPILACAVILSILFITVPRAIAIAGQFGKSPHYYCNLDATKEEKKTELYRRYCKGGSSIELENLNGHYLYQSGSGPCVGCARVNLLMRYYTKNDVNFFDYLFDETGEYQNKVIFNGSEMELTWAIFADDHGTWYKGAVYDSTSTDFLAGVGKPNANWANWGYLRNEEEYPEAMDLSSEEGWVYDKFMGYEYDMSYDPAQGTFGGTFEIDGVTATLVSSTVSSRSELMSLLDEHPCGVVIVGAYGANGGGGHGFLVTRHEDGELICVDSAGTKYTYERSENDLSFSGSKEICDFYGGSNTVVYIEEDTN